MYTKPTIFMPFYGEYGWFIMSHIRYVHKYKADYKVVCCQRGEECLFPTANEFYYDWNNPLEDVYKCNVGSWGKEDLLWNSKKDMLPVITQKWPDYDICLHYNYDCHYHTSDLIKFNPKVKNELPKIDVAIGPRFRNFVPQKNFAHWQQIIDVLHNFGLSVGLIGSKECSFDFDVKAKAWQHPHGETAGSVDILNNCRLYVGTDTGSSHLAAFLNTPMITFCKDVPGGPNLLGVMQRSNQKFYRRMDDRVWNIPEEIIGAIMTSLCDSTLDDWKKFYSQYGEDKWIVENISLPTEGTVVEIGAADGLWGSNSLHFDRRGWKCLLVEADPRQKLDYRSCLIDRCAISSSQDDKISFGLEESGLLSGILRNSQNRVLVPNKTLNKCLADNNIESVDILSIDTEGTELDVWSTFDYKKYQPKVVIMEYNTVELPDKSREVLEQMQKDNYSLVHTTDANFIFVPK